MDERYFPIFDECPNENYPDMQFYTLQSGYLLVPTRHWCLLAEITEVEYFFRLRLWAKDRSGKEFPISFYIEEDERSLDLNQFQKGRTVAILYAEQHGFLDMTVGIRQESTSTIEVRQISLIVEQFLFCRYSTCHWTLFSLLARRYTSKAVGTLPPDDATHVIQKAIHF